MLINGNGSVEWVDINGIENPNNYVSLRSHLDVKRTGWSIAWDNLSRVINGFFVYQMIQAFRKFGKS